MGVGVTICRLAERPGIRQLLESIQSRGNCPKEMNTTTLVAGGFQSRRQTCYDEDPGSGYVPVAASGITTWSVVGTDDDGSVRSSIARKT